MRSVPNRSHGEVDLGIDATDPPMINLEKGAFCTSPFMLGRLGERLFFLGGPMPALSMFFGIVVYMYRELGGKHKLPHVHAMFSGDEIVVSLEGKILEGSIPKSKLKLLLAWMEIHKDELRANWDLLSAGEQSFRIDPLR